MSNRIAALHAADPKKRSRKQLLALVPALEYLDGRTKQCFADECDIAKIMARFDRTGTISHLAKYQAVYGDFSDFDFQTQTQMLTRGREIFDELPAELRQEFGHSPEAFFAYVNNPANMDDLRKRLPALAAPGQQLATLTEASADLDTATAAASEPAASENPPAASQADPPPPQVDQE